MSGRGRAACCLASSFSITSVNALWSNPDRLVFTALGARAEPIESGFLPLSAASHTRSFPIPTRRLSMSSKGIMRGVVPVFWNISSKKEGCWNISIDCLEYFRFLSAMQTFDRLSAVDLRPLRDDQLSALRQEAMRRGVSFPELLGQLVDEVSKRLLAPKKARKSA